MKYDEKDVEEYLNSDGVKLQIETNSQIATIIRVLISNNIVTQEEFDEVQEEMKKRIKEMVKEKIKIELQNMSEETKK